MPLKIFHPIRTGLRKIGGCVANNLFSGFLDKNITFYHF